MQSSASSRTRSRSASSGRSSGPGSRSSWTPRTTRSSSGPSRASSPRRWSWPRPARRSSSRRRSSTTLDNVKRAARAERAALCALFDSLGPDAPTLCEGWVTSDLAAHLWVREHRPWDVPGMVAKSGTLHRRTDRVQARARQRGYTELVASLRGGAPVRTPFLGDAIDLHEFFVHHEDVRRANGMEPRSDPALDEALWRIVPAFGRFLTRKARAIEITLVRSDGQLRCVRKGSRRVEARGRPQELFLWLYSRPAQVEVSGELGGVRLGM
ncbi:MAG: TIGR03085 family protein [Acidimicrobiia bacterium]|nr:TIGR03085 family protein [Acidimicrobiia bacterium]